MDEENRLYSFLLQLSEFNNIVQEIDIARMPRDWMLRDSMWVFVYKCYYSSCEEGFEDLKDLLFGPVTIQLGRLEIRESHDLRRISVENCKSFNQMVRN